MFLCSVDSEGILKDNLSVISWKKGCQQQQKREHRKRWLQNHNISIPIFLSEETLLNNLKNERHLNKARVFFRHTDWAFASTTKSAHWKRSCTNISLSHFSSGHVSNKLAQRVKHTKASFSKLPQFNEVENSSFPHHIPSTQTWFYYSVFREDFLKWKWHNMPACCPL